MQNQHHQFGQVHDHRRDSQVLNMNAMTSALPPLNTQASQQQYQPPVASSYPMRNDFPYGAMSSPSFDSNHMGNWRPPMHGSDMQFYQPGANRAGYGNSYSMMFPPQDVLRPRQMQPNHSSNQSPNIAVPPSPRGPPRKPKQSGHALWVGNLPPQTSIVDLKDHFSAGAIRDIESVFHIQKTNCAFVNYSSEDACAAALRRFHNSRFHGRCLVCRLRKGSSGNDIMQSPTFRKGSSSNETVQSPTLDLENTESLAPNPDESRSSEAPMGPLIVNGTTDSTSKEASGSQPPSGESNPARVPARFFILKSLTLQDLQASLTTKEWSTQPHVEAVLKEAFDSTDNVYLFFSANRSGEYFGYARMSSTFSEAKEKGRKIEAVEPAPEPDNSSPRSIPTGATKTAPAGRIIDDTARGTIFWEADHSSDPAGEDEASDTQTTELNRSNSKELSKNKSFAIEWLSTNTLPFYRTRGMRNLWNSNQEIKIARDGTELEPKIGWRLMALF